MSHSLDMAEETADFKMPEGATVTVVELNGLVEELAKQRAVCAEIDGKLKEENKKKMILESKCVAYLKELKMDSHRTPIGTMYVIEKWTVKTPQSDEEKKAFFDWCTELGIYYKYASVNSQSLNSLYKEQAEEAKARGEFLNMPGIGSPSLHESLGFRKAAK